MTGPQGPRGYTGAPGTPGQAGPQGQPGPKGDTGYADAFVPDSASITAVGQAYVDADGYLEVCTSLDPIAFVKGALVKGPKGDKGEAGEQGEPGLTASVEVNGQVYTADDAGKITLPNYPEEVAWGNIQGTLSNQTDLQTALNSKQSVISDLADIREGAALGKTSLQDDVLPILVTKNTDQTITGKKTFNGVVAFGDENGEGGNIYGDAPSDPNLDAPSMTLDSSINTHNPYKSSIILKSATVSNSSDKLVSGPSVFFKGDLKPLGDKKFDIGSYGNQIKDLYIAGNLITGPKKDTIAVANIASKSELQNNYVSCAEAQELTTEQKNRAKANLELPYVSSEETALITNKNNGVNPSANSDYSIYDSNYSFKKLLNLPEGVKIKMTATSPDGSFTETVYAETFGTNWYRTTTDCTNTRFFNTTSKSLNPQGNYFSFSKKDTSGIVSSSDTWKFTISYWKPIYNNLISKEFINAPIVADVKYEAPGSGSLPTAVFNSPNDANSGNTINGGNVVFGSGNRIENSRGSTIIG